MKDYPLRFVNYFDLGDDLRKLEQQGISVPTLNSSNLMPTYSYTTEKDVEIYCLGGVELEVPKGSVIDSHGNVVDMSTLKNKQLINAFEPSQRDLVTSLVNTYFQPSSSRIEETSPSGIITVYEKPISRPVLVFGSIPTQDKKSSIGFRKTPDGKFVFSV